MESPLPPRSVAPSPVRTRSDRVAGPSATNFGGRGFTSPRAADYRYRGVTGGGGVAGDGSVGAGVSAGAGGKGAVGAGVVPGFLSLLNVKLVNPQVR